MIIIHDRYTIVHKTRFSFKLSKHLQDSIQNAKELLGLGLGSSCVLCVSLIAKILPALRHRDSGTLRHALRPEHLSAEPGSVTECASENTLASRLSSVIYPVLVCMHGLVRCLGDITVADISQAELCSARAVARRRRWRDVMQPATRR